MNIEKIQRATSKFARVRLKKIHLDYIAGLLSIPVLITAIMINWGNLSKNVQPAAKTTSPSPQVIVVPQNTNSASNTEPTSTSCKKGVGPIAITSPQEGDSVSDNPVCVTIDYSDPSYCGVVWSYRINGGSWSDFNNTSPCLYNLPSGNVHVDLRVNSTSSTDQRTLSRNFTYTGSNNSSSTPTPTSVASSSAH